MSTSGPEEDVYFEDDPDGTVIVIPTDDDD